jgi:ubiquinone/menaquinone biosynthesis C-methylase UbiE
MKVIVEGRTVEVDEELAEWYNKTAGTFNSTAAEMLLITDGIDIESLTDAELEKQLEASIENELKEREYLSRPEMIEAALAYARSKRQIVSMNSINNTAVVKQQYANADNLNTRISIHDRYSTNTVGFGNWIVSHYRIDNGMKVLELGCGTGDMWKGRDTLINSCSKLVLSDFSEGMVATTKELLCNYDNIEYRVIDIQEIPYGDETFDVVIANMMLYHVPDLERGLAEVRRVLKKNGSFYCATYGEHGIIEYLSKILAAYGVKDNLNKNFTLQNGYEILSRFFLKVEKLEYIDSLAVTCVDDMVDYIYSLSSMNALGNIAKKEIKQILIQNTVNGVLNVPKEYGMFIAT